MKTLEDVFDEGAVLKARLAYTRALEDAGFPKKLIASLVYTGWFDNREALQAVIVNEDSNDGQ